ncbi:MAG: FecR family protein [Elusimicrobiota bacterium]|nr:MAG: FecR family protein [Elusimicrobiota bacterium]
MRKLLALLLCASSPAQAATVNIGVASAVRGAVKAVAPGAAGRVVETGKPVYSHDKVTTGPEGKLQILLLDQTSFTIGPNSEMELDEFVFDPATNAGKVSAKIAKGAFRFVTGKVARRDPSAMQVATPVGTIGIRGTMTAGTVSETEGTFVLLGPGPENNADEKAGGITVKNDKGSTDVDTDGWGVTVKAGEAPSDPFQIPPGALEGILNGVGSAPKGTRPPTRPPEGTPRTPRPVRARPRASRTPWTPSRRSTRPRPRRASSPLSSSPRPRRRPGRTSSAFRAAPASTRAPALTTTARAAPASRPRSAR